MLVKFADLLNAKYNDKQISVKAVVSGKSVSPYSIPKRVEVTCRKGKDCDDKCSAFNKDSFIIDAMEGILKFVDVNESTFYHVIMDIFGISCKSFSCKIKSVQNLERIFISAPTGRERIKNASSYPCYFIGYGIDINTMYEMSGIPTNEPKTQISTCVFTDAKKVKTDVESFVLDKSTHKELEVFQIDERDPNLIFDYLIKIYDSYASNITKIYGRVDLHMAVDLLFHSPMTFKFDKENVHKGWMDIAVIGDTRCGKGYVAENLVKYYGVGEVISGDNCSFSGLVGGLQQYSNQWVISWGKIPMNDQGLVVIDEASEIKPEDWTRLSRVRSEGLAEIIKIHAQATNARTRLLFLLNPPYKTISNYSYGIQSIMDVVKAPEDVARFDFVLVVAHDEVSIDDINQSRDVIPEMFTQELEQKLIMWVWSRKKSDIQFSDEAIQRVYALSKLLAKRFTFAVPLIQGENVRIKIAKLAICFAGRLYSNKKNGQILFVDTHHVDCAYVFLNMIYNKESSGYAAMSVLQKSLDNGVNDESIASIEHYFRTFHNKKARLLKCLLQNSAVTSNDLVEQVNLTKEISHEILSKLIDKGMIVKRGPVYVKTPGFTTYLKRVATDIILKGDKK